MKKFLLVLLMVAVLMITGGFLFVEKLDGLVKNRIESVGTETLGQTVSVENVNIELKSGMGAINGLKISNPEGFTDKDIFKMDNIRMQIDLASLSKSPLVLDEFVIEAPEVSLEVRKDGSFNLKAISVQLPSSPEPKVFYLSIKQLRIAGVQLTLRHPFLGDQVKSFILPDINLKNIGGDKGVTPAKLTEVILRAVAKEGLKKALMAQEVK